MILAALNDDQHDVLIDTLHYLVRKMELQDNQGKEINVNRMKILRSIQEQLLHPKRICFGLDKQGYQYEIKSMIVDTNQIFLRPY